MDGGVRGGVGEVGNYYLVSARVLMGESARYVTPYQCGHRTGVTLSAIIRRSSWIEECQIDGAVVMIR